MDLPRFLHHNTSRYDSLPPPPLAPPPPSTPRPQFPDASNFQSPNHHHHSQPQPLPRPQPPRLPPSYQQNLPPPPPLPPQQHQHLSFNPTQSRFAFSSSSNPYPAHAVQNLTQLRREDDRPRHRLSEIDHSRPDFWDPSRALPDNQRPAVRSYHLPFDFDRKDGHLHQRSFDRPVDKVRHDPESSSRFRVEYTNGFDPNHGDDNFVWDRRDENFLHRDHFLSTSDSSGRDFGFASNSRGNESSLGGYDHRYGSSRDNEACRSGRINGSRDGQVSRDINDLLYEMGSSEIGDGAGVRIGSTKHEYFGAEVARYNHNRGSREGSHEYNRTPRKQIQKKSAFLRIQMAKPSHRNRESEQLHYSGFLDKSNSSSFRGKDQYMYSDYMMEEEDVQRRKGSPVELDVSFKSNSLVAKAIVAPSSSAVVSDTDRTPGNEKIRKFCDGDCSNSRLGKLNQGSVKMGSSKCVAKKPSTSEKDSKQLEEKAKSSDFRGVCDGSSQPFSGGAGMSQGKSKVERSSMGTVSEKDHTNIGSGKKTASKVVKKKKVVKKVVKKVINPQSRLSSSQKAKKCDKPVKADSLAQIPTAAFESDKLVTPLEQIITSDGMVSRHNVVLQPFTEKLNELPGNDKGDGSFLAAVSHDRRIEDDSGRICVPKVNRNWNTSTSPLGSSSLAEDKIDESSVTADNNGNGLHAISNSDNGLSKPQNKDTISEIGRVEDVSKQFCVPEKEFGEDNVNYGMLSSEKTKIHEDISNTSRLTHGTDNSLVFEYGIVKSQENIAVCDEAIIDVIRKQPCTNQFTTSLENSMAEGIRQALVGSSAICGLSSSEGTGKGQGLAYAECSNHGRDTTRDSDHDCTSLGEKNTVFCSGIINKTDEHPSAGGATRSLENHAMESSPNGVVSVKASEGKTHGIKKRRRISTQLDFSDSTIIHVGPVKDIVVTADPVDTNLCSSPTSSSPAEVAVSSVGSLNVGLLPGTDVISVLHANGSGSDSRFTCKNDGHSHLDGTSPRYKKKREASTSESALPGSTVSEKNDRPMGTVTSCAEEVSITNTDNLTQEVEVAMSSINHVCTSGLMSFAGTPMLLENTLREAVGAIRGVSTDDGLNLLHVGVGSCSNAEDPNARSPCQAVFGIEQKEIITPLTLINVNQNSIMDVETNVGVKMDAHAAEDQILIHVEAQRQITSGPHSPDLDQRFSHTDVEADLLLLKDDLPSVSSHPSLSDDGAGVSSSNSHDEVMESVSRTLPGPRYPETLSKVLSIDMLDCKASPSQISSEKVSEVFPKLDQKSVIEGGSYGPAHTPFPRSTQPDPGTEMDHSIGGKTIPLLSQDSKITAHSLNLMSAELVRSKTQLGHSLPRTLLGHPSFLSTNSKRTASSTRMVKPRTWHRSGNHSVPPRPENKPFSNAIPPKRQLVENNAKSQYTSYIRKGNSLVRKASPVAAQHQDSHALSSSVFRANSSGIDESRKSLGYDSKVDFTDPQNLLRTGMYTPFERPRTPPLSSGTKLSTQNAASSGDNLSSSLAEHHFSGSCETSSDPMKFPSANNVAKIAQDSLKITEISENLTGTSSNLESQTELTDGNVASKRIVYVKRKSNQLVATSDPCDLSLHGGNKSKANSDAYYKRSKNQLIRASLENQIMQSVTVHDDLSNSEGQQAPKVVPCRKFGKRQLHKVIAKTRKPIKSSLVWTLRGVQSSKNNPDSLHHQKVLPYLFPWKRTYRKSFMQNPNSISNNNSLPMISRKLLLSRKRDTVYTRSVNGFSLRKYKVFSVGGSSLKWSKSIEKNSKKVNEEATRAVAAVEREKREQNGAASSSSQKKNRNHSSRERVFRIGSFRYKMDSTKRTLLRISDDESTCSTAPQSGKDVKKSYIPRRLVIGNDEYVRIGNGNQLIRDPKKRSRILASEKVRWSLHTARLRLARKRTYCQFFTRFGKCNKDDGKCPYIHDPSKIAVCTKFLNGLCSNPNCKLTHKVIPERMPDCSYFLQGLCNNRNCPYRHVNVNPKASTCEGFLRGYCADGNECRKKHSYVCPIFEATGSCPQGSKCKLHHPKNRSKGKRKKRLGTQKNTRGRYFGFMNIKVSEPGTAVHEKHFMRKHDDVLQGNFSEYISVDESNEEVGDCNDPRSEQTFCDSDSAEVQLEDLFELIKPVRIMFNEPDNLIVSKS